MVTWKEQLAVLPEVSVAVQVTAVFPRGNAEPVLREQLTVVNATLSVAVGGGYDTATVDDPITGAAVWAFGHVIMGGIVSGTTTLKVGQDA